MSKAILFGLSTIVGTGVPTTMGAYYWTEETIWDKLSEDAIPEQLEAEENSNLKNVWSKLKVKLKSNEKIKTGDLNSLKTDGEDNDGSKLSLWCFRSYKETYWNWFQRENTKLKDDVKDVCVYTIEEQLGENKITISGGTSNTNETEFKKKMNVLKDHNDSKVPLEEDLINIKKVSDNENEWKKLEEWCKKTYKRGFQGERSVRWKLAELYCKKSQ